MENLRIFGLGNSWLFAKNVSTRLQNGYSKVVFVNQHNEEIRPDGELYTVSLDNVRGCDVYVITSMYGDDGEYGESVNDKLMKTLIFINSLRHASAARITLCVPYLPYMRQDRKSESRAPIATQAIAIMLEGVGMHRLLTVDVHNLGAEQNAFRVPIDNLEARKLLADAVSNDIIQPSPGIMTDCYVPFKVLSPDSGGTARTKLFQHSLEKRLKTSVGIVYADKTRLSADRVEVKIVGDVARHNVVVVDDMISTGNTIREVGDAVYKAGGRLWGVVATHGLFVNGAPENLANVPRIYTTDTIPPFRLKGTPIENNVKVVSTIPMFAEAIGRIHNDGGSISELLQD